MVYVSGFPMMARQILGAWELWKYSGEPMNNIIMNMNSQGVQRSGCFFMEHNCSN
jgi:hypothetical protein